MVDGGGLIIKEFELVYQSVDSQVHCSITSIVFLTDPGHNLIEILCSAETVKPGPVSSPLQ